MSALIIGAGSGIGAAVARRFAREGLICCCVRRSDGEKLDALVSDINASGGRALAIQADATCEDAVAHAVTLAHAEAPLQFALYNLGANVGHRTTAKTTARVFEQAWRMGALGALHLARAAAPIMASSSSSSGGGGGGGGGSSNSSSSSSSSSRNSSRNCSHGSEGCCANTTLAFTGATASVRGAGGQAAHASAMHARRALAQSLAHEWGPQGIHVCHVVVDGMVDAPDTLGKYFPEQFAAAKAVLEPVDGIVRPEAVADAYWYLHSQPRSAWTFEIDLRPWRDAPWWTSDPITPPPPPPPPPPPGTGVEDL